VFGLTSNGLAAKRRCMVSNRLLMASLCCISLCSCSKSPQSQTEIEKRLQDEAVKTETENRIQEQAAKIAAERERLAELQQEQREKVAADLASRTDTRETRRVANLERAAAEQARREGITAELKAFIDALWIQVMAGQRHRGAAYERSTSKA
jgi:molecular chaperone GrpE (heat shock protein)